MEEVQEAEGSSTLVSLCVRVVSSNMERLEPEVWELPAVILQDILPFLNIYYLDRIEPAAVKKGLSTQSIWRRLCKDVMKLKSSRFETITCWRKKFLEVFFHHVLRGILNVASDKRLTDQRFSPLIHSSQHVTELTICNKLQGVSELTPPVVEALVHSVRTLKFLHLRSPDLVRQQSLCSLLHRLIHHGEVNKVALLSWPAPDTQLLVLIMSISAGFWIENYRNSCRLCDDEARREGDNLLLEGGQLFDAHVPYGGPLEELAGDSSSDQYNLECEMVQEETQSALLTLQPLDLNQRPWEDPSKTQNKSISAVTVATNTRASKGNFSKNTPRQQTSTNICPTDSDQCKQPSPTSKKRLQVDLGKKNNSDTQHATSSGLSGSDTEEDLYDFIFSVANEKKTKTSYENKGLLAEKGDVHTFSSSIERCLGAPFFDPTRRFRSISALNLHNVPLTLEYCHILCNLLSTWFTLEKLTMAYNDLGSNIFPVLEALVSLSHYHDCCLRTVSLSDFTVYIPTLELAHTILTAFPSLHVLSLSFDLENFPEKPRMEGSTFDFPENQLEALDIRFPREPLHTDDLLSLLRGSRKLNELSLDNATFSSFEELRHTLQTLTEYNTTLKRLSFHDMYLADCQDEILLLLQKSHLEDVKISFCHLFEKRALQFLSDMVHALKRNSALKTLKLCGNRLGNDGLILLADLFSEDSLSRIHCLDVSSNCIKSDGLLQFAKKLEYGLQSRPGLQLKLLSLSQNLLDRDPMMAQEALHLLQGMCTVISDKWDSAKAFADHVSIM
ncbi:leucine-rich repeat-containing protein 41 [Ambystoma mexicanum]|uniref:leucine-rich repeat-containing protein 41 n=1 Tax=Ambystoma mexicanum TaxID=8296 RepID=UPI0037E74641